LTQRTSDLGPNGVNIIVQSLQGEDLELGLILGEEGENACSRDEARHDDGDAALRASIRICGIAGGDSRRVEAFERNDSFKWKL
jgi:hypothetical protein